MVTHLEALSQEERQQYLGEVIDFFNSSQTTRAAFDAGRNYHRSRVVLNQPASWLNLDELDERIDLAKQVQDNIRATSPELTNPRDLNAISSFRLNLIQFSTFLCADLENLRTIITDPASGGGLTWYNRIRNVESFVATCTYPLHDCRLCRHVSSSVLSFFVLGLKRRDGRMLLAMIIILSSFLWFYKLILRPLR